MSMDSPDIVLLREILARELETINTYHSLLERSTAPEVADFIGHIIDEEKEHVAEAMELINQIDHRQAARFGEGAHYRIAPAEVSPQVAPDKTVAHEMNARQLTVGSLRNNR